MTYEVLEEGKQAFNKNPLGKTSVSENPLGKRAIGLNLLGKKAIVENPSEKRVPRLEPFFSFNLASSDPWDQFSFHQWENK